MAIENEENRFTFKGVIYEDEVVSFRDQLQSLSPKEMVCDFTECDDIHMAVLQLIMAYKKNYDVSYIYGDNKKVYEKVLDGFAIDENDCS